jgi:hypothetical protein
MKKNTLPAVGLVMPACLLFIFSCQKSGGLPVQDEAANFCAIKRVSYQLSSEYPYRDTIAFFYDRLGRPDSSTRVYVGDDAPRYLFRYDRRGNLQDFIGAYNNGAAEFWTRYTYSEDNRTVWDSTYTLVSQYKTWPPLGGSALLVPGTIKKYDAEGRVIQIFYPYIPPIVTPDSVYIGYYNDITYDAKGNVEGIGLTYDDKINYHRTNKVWMFLDDQYSVNNPFPIDAYNALGLPIKFNSVPYRTEYPNYYPILFNQTYGQVVIDYDCELPKGPVPGE